MGFEEIVYRMDHAKIKVTSGDLPDGYWELKGNSLEQMPAIPQDPDVALQTVQMSDSIKSLDIDGFTENNPVGNILGIGVGALTGFRFIGPVGALIGGVAGHYVSGNRKQVSIHCALRDGRSFHAMMDPAIFERLQAIAKLSHEESSTPD